MARSGVVVGGVEELLTTLKGVEPKLAENSFRNGVSAVAREGRRLTRQNIAPHDRTGNLRKSVRVSSRIRRAQRRVEAKFGYRQTRRSHQMKGWTLDRIARERSKADGFYGRFLEDGTETISSPPRFLLRAAVAVTPRAISIMRARIVKTFDRDIAKARRGR